MGQHFRNAVDNFEILVNMAQRGGSFDEEEIEALRYHVMYLKMYPAYGKLPEPPTSEVGE